MVLKRAPTAYAGGPHLYAARVVHFETEARHDPSLREALSPGRAELEPLVVVALARLGARRGPILHRIARHDTTDPRLPVARRKINFASCRWNHLEHELPLSFGDPYGARMRV